MTAEETMTCPKCGARNLRVCTETVRSGTYKRLEIHVMPSRAGAVVCAGWTKKVAPPA